MEVSVEVTLFCVPGDMPATVTVMVQVLLAGMVPPAREIELLPATAVTVPPQVLAMPGALPITSPTGRVSENAMPVRATGFEFPMVNVRVVVWLANIDAAAPNVLVNVGA